jgi:transposase InsO family protein
MLSVDLFGPLTPSRGGVRHVFVILDVFSKYVGFYATKKATKRAVLRCLMKHWEKHGKPVTVLSDQGTQFTAKLWSSTLAENDVGYVYTSVHHPPNPAERVIR